MLGALLTSLLLAQAAPAASGFAATFTPEAVASHLDGKLAYLLVGAGKSGPALTAALGALEAALRQGGKAELVLTGSSLGPVEELSDPDIVKKAAPLPVSRLAVVRVFEAAAEPPRAVVVVYDQAGAIQAAFTGQAGTALAPGQRGGAAVAGQGVSAGVAAKVLQASNPGAQAEYDEKFLKFDDLTTIDQYGTMKHWTMPRQGKVGRMLEGDAFYRALGRDDLVARYQENEKKRTTVRIVGITIAVAVPVIALATTSKKDCGSEPSVSDPNFGTRSQQYSDCTSSNNQAQMTSLIIAGAGAAAGLGIAIIGGNAIELHPIDGNEARRLGEEYNKKLKDRLGLAQDAPRARAPPAISLAVTLVPVPGGGMVGLGLAF